MKKDVTGLTTLENQPWEDARIQIYALLMWNWSLLITVNLKSILIHSVNK